MKLFHVLFLLLFFFFFLSCPSLIFGFVLPSHNSKPCCPFLRSMDKNSYSPPSKKKKYDKNSELKMSGIAASATAGRRLVGKLRPETTAFLLCDIQERFREKIWKCETVISTSRYLTSVAKALDIPIVVTQQYTKVFGPTVPDCFEDPTELESKKIPVFEKKNFSMCTDEVCTHMDKLNKDSIVLFGIEAHVCVQQTALDLLEQGKDVHIIADAVSSQQSYDRQCALQRMAQAGAYVTTAQSAAFMLMKTAEHANFKAVSKLTVDHMKLPNEFNE